MLSNIPCLLDLKSPSLRERHWKAISEVVGAEVKANKVTLGLLEQNNVFASSSALASIVR